MNLKELEQWTKRSLNSCIELGYNKKSFSISLFGAEAFLRKEKWHIERDTPVRFKVIVFDGFFTENKYYFVLVRCNLIGFYEPKIEYCEANNWNQIDPSPKYLVRPTYYGDHKFKKEH